MGIASGESMKTTTQRIKTETKVSADEALSCWPIKLLLVLKLWDVFRI